MNGLLLIRRSVLKNGSILGILTGVNVVIDDSTLIYVDVESSGNSHYYYIASFLLRHSTFHHRSISIINHQTSLISSNITLAKSPLTIDDRSKILCISITRSIETDLNRIGIEADHVIIKDSSIYNFEIGIRVFKASIISSSNIYDNSLYNIENQGTGDIHTQLEIDGAHR
jgi:hypothetical protein